MKIEIVPVEELTLPSTKIKQAERGGLGGFPHEPSLLEAIEPVQSEVITLEDIFAKFIQLEVGDGAASNDTIRNYLSQTKQYLNWCQDNLLSPIEAEPEDIKLYRQHLVQSQYANSTIATKLDIIRIFYKAAQAHGLITSNPAAKVKAPQDRKDPAARITFLEAEELKFLLDHIQSQLDRAKTNKQRLTVLRDRLLIGIMSLEGCRTVEMHQLKVEDIVRQGNKTGLQVSAKRASRIVPLTENLAGQLDDYLQIRRKVLRRKIKPTDYVF
ncbi:MAG: phage integrase N-terminal SAM-like domain-containing protein, partial [Cyanobacteria bacterium J06631_2]